MKKQLQRYLSILCVATMLFGILPTDVLAESVAEPAAVVTEVAAPAPEKPAAPEKAPEKPAEPEKAPEAAKPAEEKSTAPEKPAEPAKPAEEAPKADPAPADDPAPVKPASDETPAAPAEQEKEAEQEEKTAEATPAPTPIPMPTIPVDASLKVGGSANGKIKKNNTSIMRLTVAKAEGLNLSATGMDLWVEVLNEKTNERNRYTSKEGSLFVHWSAKKGTYLLTFGALKKNASGSFTVRVFNDEALLAQETEKAAEEPVQEETPVVEEPAAEVTEPVAEEPVAEPETETEEPAAEATEPEAQDEEPAVEVTEPVAEEPVTEPETETEQPAAEATEPEAQDEEPAAEVTEPAAEEPVAEPETEQPAAEATEPEAQDEEPAAEVTEPMAGEPVVEPETETEQPAAEATEPEENNNEETPADTQEPVAVHVVGFGAKTTEAEPEVKEEQPAETEAQDAEPAADASETEETPAAETESETEETEVETEQPAETEPVEETEPAAEDEQPAETEPVEETEPATEDEQPAETETPDEVTEPSDEKPATETEGEPSEEDNINEETDAETEPEGEAEGEETEDGEAEDAEGEEPEDGEGEAAEDEELTDEPEDAALVARVEGDNVVIEAASEILPADAQATYENYGEPDADSWIREWFGDNAQAEIPMEPLRTKKMKAAPATLTGTRVGYSVFGVSLIGAESAGDGTYSVTVRTRINLRDGLDENAVIDTASYALYTLNGIEPVSLPVSVTREGDTVTALTFRTNVWGLYLLRYVVDYSIVPEAVPQGDFSYTFAGAGSAVTLGQILDANGITVTRDYPYVTVSDPNLVTVEQISGSSIQDGHMADYLLTANNAFGNVVLTVSHDGAAFSIDLSCPQAIEPGTVVESAAGSFAADTAVPAGTVLVSAPADEDAHVTAAAKAILGDEAQVAFYDWSLVAPNGDKVQTGADITVNTDIALPENTEVTNLVVFHVQADGTVSSPIKADYVVENGRIVKVALHADGFSTYGVAYTVEFHYGDEEVVLEGGSQILLSDLLARLGFEDTDVSKIESVAFSDPDLVKVEEVSGVVLVNGVEVDAGERDFLITSERPFTTNEMLVISYFNDEEIQIDVTDDQSDGVWDLTNGENTLSIHVSADSSVTQTEQERDASFRATLTYTLKEDVVKAIDDYDKPFTLVYDLSSTVEGSSPLESATAKGTISIGTRKIGNYRTVGNKVYLEFTDPSYFDGRTSFTGFFQVTLNTSETELGSRDEYTYEFPGTSDTIPIHYKQTVEEGSKSVNKTGPDGNGNYTLHYTANINVNSDLDSMTFNDVLGGLQTLDTSSVKIGGQPVTVSQTGNGFNFDVATALGTTGVAKGSYQVTYDTKVTAEQLEAMTADKTTETNTANWMVNGDKNVPGGKTTVEIDKPKDPIPVTKTISSTTNQPGDVVYYTVTYGDEKTDLAGFHISDAMTDVVIPQGQITLTFNGQTQQINFDSSIADASYSKGMATLFDYTFPEGTAGKGPVQVSYSVKLIDAATAKSNGVYDTTDVINTAQEHRQNTTATEKTTVPYEKEQIINVDKAVTSNPASENNKWQPGSTLTYTLTIGDAETNMAGVHIFDEMTDLQILQGDVMIQVGSGPQQKLNDYVSGAVTYTDDHNYNLGNVTLFDFNMPSEAGKGPVVITYTTKVIDQATAENAGFYGEKAINNVGHGGKGSGGTGGTGVFGDYPVDKHVFQDGANVDGQTVQPTKKDPETGVETPSKVRYVMSFGKAGMNMGGATIYDEMTDLQKLVSSVTITKANGSTFTMPTGTGQWAADGVVWSFFDDETYSTGMVRVFNYILPQDIGEGPITVEYETQIISEDKARENGIVDTQNAKNIFRVNNYPAETDINIDFPKAVKHEPQVSKEFDHWDLVNQKVYWNIILEKTDESAYPLENVTVRENDWGGIYITEKKVSGWDNYQISDFSLFDVLRAEVTTDDGTVLTPGIDYTVNRNDASFTFPQLNERVHINLAFNSPIKIVDGYYMHNKVRLTNNDKTGEAEQTYNHPELTVIKNGSYTESDRLIKWEVQINPSKIEYPDTEPPTVYFKDVIPEGLTLVNYSNHSDTQNPTINVYYNGSIVDGYNQQFAVSIGDSNVIGPMDIAGHSVWGSANCGLNKQKYIVTYYTMLSDEEWDRITSSASGSESYTNSVTVSDGNGEEYNDTDTVTVSSDGYVKKEDSTMEHGGIVVTEDEDGTFNASKEITYRVEINPHAYNMNNGEPLTLTDRIDTNMDLDTSSVKVTIATVGSDGKLVHGSTVPTGLEVSYNDDSRLLAIRGIPDQTSVLLTYTCFARAQGQDTFVNTATLIGGGSHSSTVSKQHNVQTNDAGVKIDSLELNLHKIDENDISTDLSGAKFQLYECELAKGEMSYVTDHEWLHSLLNKKLTDAELAQFKITNYRPIGDPVVTGRTGFTQWGRLNECKLYAWKETEAPSGYTASDEYHYFVLYQHIDVNDTEHVPQQLLPDTIQKEHKEVAWSLDDACQAANNIRVASMANLTTWTATNIKQEYTSITATKSWVNDSDNLFETRPTDGIKLQLYKILPDGTKEKEGEPVAINVGPDGTWPDYIWSKLPAMENAQPIKYTVVEERVDNYTTTYSDNGAGVASGTITVTNKMKPKTTSIEVHKEFDPDGDEKPDQILVELFMIKTNKQGESVKESTGLEGALTEENGWSYTFEKLDTTLIEDGIPYTLTYTVEEQASVASQYDEVTYSDNGEGVVDTDDGPLTITNRKITTGDMKLKKVLAEDLPEDVEPTAFTFTITFTGGEVDGQYALVIDPAGESDPATIAVSDNTATIALLPGQEATIKGLPLGVGYAVAEQTVKGYSIVSQIGDTGTIEKKVVPEAVFTNKYETNGSLKITKAVTINGAPTTDALADGDYLFTVYTDEDCTTPLKKDGADVTATLTVANGVAQPVVISEIPAADYWIKETVPTSTGFTPIGDNPFEVTVVAGSTAETAAVAAFTNNKDVGHLIVKKTVTGRTDTENSFTFNIALTAASEGVTVDGTYDAEKTLADGTVDTSVKTVIVANGEASVTLKAGEQIKIKNLPDGTRYSVTESGTLPTGYTEGTHTGASGTISKDADAATVTADMNNTYDTSTTAHIEALKVFTNGTLTAGQFSFVLEGSPNPMPKDAEVSCDAQGNIVFGDMTYTLVMLDGVEAVEGVKTKVFTYTLKEKLPQSAATDPHIADGIKYDAHTETIKVTVEYNVSTGVMTATVDKAKTDLKFTNEQLGKLTVTKTFSGLDDADLDTVRKAFSITVKGEGLPTDGQTVTWSQMTNGSYTFENLTIGETYQVTETIAEAGQTVIAAKYTQITEGEGASVTEGTGTATLDGTGTGKVDLKNNYEKKPGSLKLTKQVKVNNNQPAGDTLKVADGEYTFTITGPDDYSAVVVVTVSDGVAASAVLNPTTDKKNLTPKNGWFVISGLTEGTYTISETTPENGTWVEGENPKTVTVVAGVDDPLPDTASATFTNAIEVTDIEVDKKWVNADGTDTWPTGVKVTVQLTADGQPVMEGEGETQTPVQAELSSTHTTHTFKNLPAKKQNAEGKWTDVIYGVKEVEISGYATKIGDPVKGADKTTITITNEEETTEIPVNKAWAFANPSSVAKVEGKDWPQGVTVEVQLYSGEGDAAAPVVGKKLTLTADKTSDKFTALPKNTITVNTDGTVTATPIAYSVVEAGVTGVVSGKFTTAISGNATDGYTITNTEKTAGLTITKSFTGATLTNEQKKNITFTVTGEGFTTQSKTYNQFTDGSWKLTQADGILPGKIYTVTESYAGDAEGITGYTCVTKIKANDGEEKEAATTQVTIDAGTGIGTVTVTNTYTKEKTEISGTKVWVDEKEHTNATEITLKLCRTTDTQITDDTAWEEVKNVTPTWEGNTYKFTELDKYSDATETEAGKLYTYRVVEGAIENYETTYTGGKDYALDKEQIINTELTSLPVEKTWVNADGTNTWPASVAKITVQLTKKVGEGEATDVADKKVELTSQKTSDTFTNLPKYAVAADGAKTKIVYGVKEVEIEGYISAIGEPDDDGKITITNTQKKVVAEIKVEKALEGREWKTDDSFTFTLSAADGAPMPLGTDGKPVTSITITGADTEKVKSFGSIVFTAAGTYTYTVTEIVGNDSSMVYDNHTETVTITVTPDSEAEGKLAAAVGYSGGKDAVAAKYTNKQLGKLTVTKTFAGLDAADLTTVKGAFSITVTGKDIGEGDTATVTWEQMTKGEDGKSASYTFNNLPIGETYEVEETIAKDTETELLKEYTLITGEGDDASVTTGTGTTTLDGTGTGKVDLKNNYKKKPGSLKFLKTVTAGGETVEGGTLADGTFSFTIAGPDGYSATVEVTVTKGKAASATLKQGDEEPKSLTPDEAGWIVISGLAAGEYTITENAPTNGSKLVGKNGLKVTVEAGVDEPTQLPETAKFTNDLELVELPVKKVWKNADGTDAVWPEGVEVTVHVTRQIGEATEIVDTKTLSWKEPEYTFHDLPKYTADEDGTLTEIQYSVEEEAVPGYISTVSEPDETTGLITITNTKAGKPTFEKKIMDVNDTTGVKSDWRDSADYDIGDEVPFKLTATLAGDVTSYKKYHITFIDSLDLGLEFNKITSVKVGNSEVTDYEFTAEDPNYFVLTLRWAGDNGGNITDTALNGATVEVFFNAKLTEEAIIGNVGNVNTACMRYSNNPSSTDDSDEGETEYDSVIVFTYKLDIGKTDEAGAPLTGAEFKLEKKLADGTTKEITLTANGATFSAKGLDDGDYILTETKAPKGYDPIDPITFTVTAAHKDVWEGEDRTTILTSLTGETESGEITFTEDANKAGLTGSVANTELTELPVEKAWKNADGSTDWPASVAKITVQLTKKVGEGEATDVADKNVELTSQKTSDTFTDLPKYEVVTGEDGTKSKQLITYGVKEVTVPGYASKVGDPDKTTGKITITNTEQKVEGEIKVEKVLEGRDWTTDDSFTFTLSAADGTPMPLGTDGQPVTSLTITSADKNAEEKYIKSFGSITFTAKGTYTYTVKETKPAENPLPSVKYDETEHTVTIEIVEAEDGSLVAKEGTELIQTVTITNTYETGSLKVTKAVTQNGAAITSDAIKAQAAETYSFTVYTDADCKTAYQVDGKPATLTVTIGEDGKAAESDVLSGLPLGDYWIKEGTPDNGFKPVTNPVKVTVTAENTAEEPAVTAFTNNIETKTIKAKKAWPEGQTVPEGTEVTLTLFQGEGDAKDMISIVTLDGKTETKPWEYEWTDLPKYDVAEDGTTTEIRYTVEETEYVIGTDYKETDPAHLPYSTDEPKPYDFYFRNELPTTSVDVEKKWENADESTTWPEGVTVTVQLYSGEGDKAEAVKDQTLELDAETMSGSFTDLPMYAADGSKITYSVVEAGVTGVDAENYKTIVTGSAKDGYTITNKAKDEYGMLQVTKTVTVSDNNADVLAKVFMIAVKDADGNFMAVDGTNLGSTPHWVEIEKDEPIIWNHLPLGEYSIEEQAATAEAEGYDLTTTVTPDSVTLTKENKDAAAEVTVDNTYTRKTGELEISKNMLVDGTLVAKPAEGETGTINALYYGRTFYVTIKKLGDETLWVTSDSGELGDKKTVFTVTPGTTLKIKNLPTGSYQVIEVADDKGTATSDTNMDINAMQFLDAPLSNVILTVEVGESAATEATADGGTAEAEGGAEALLVNAYTTGKYCIAVTKQWLVNGEIAEGDELEVTLTRSVNGVKDEDFEKTFTLTKENNWSAVAVGMDQMDAAGNRYTYTWSEGDHKGWAEGKQSEVQVSEKVDTMVFLTVLTNSKVTEQPKVTKEVEGSGAKFAPDADYTFTLAASDPEDAPMPKADTVIKVKAGETGTFGEITFTEAGEYIYTITEKAGTTADMTYDTAPKYVKVVVAEDKDTKVLSATVTYGEDEKTIEDESLTVTNTYEPVVKTSVTKIWSEDASQKVNRPDTVTMKLLANNKEYASFAIGPDYEDEESTDPQYKSSFEEVDENTWKLSVENLPKYVEGVEQNYTWLEDMAELEGTGYTISGFEVAEDGSATITNTAGEPGRFCLAIVKVWDDANDQDGKRPEGITVTLLADGEAVKEVPLDEDNHWTYLVTSLPIYNADGEAIVYEWQEDEDGLPEGYEAVENPVSANAGEGETRIGVLTNTYAPVTTEASIQKIWNDNNDQDGKRPDSLTVSLKANGGKAKYSDGTDVEDVTLNVAGKWAAKVENLPKYADGKEIEYTWVEVDLPEGYKLTDTSVKGTVTTLTNSLTLEETEATIIKVWDDAENQDGKRPESLTVSLLADGDPAKDAEGQELTATLSEAEKWTAKVENLPKYADGKEIKYTWTEDETGMPEGYELTDTSIDGTVTTLTNSYTPEEVEISVEKVWDDANDQDGKRPETITVSLLADDEAVDEAVLDESNEWKHTWTKLKKFNGSKTPIEYTVDEPVLPEGYEVKIEAVKDDGNVTGYKITNTHVPEKTFTAVEKAWDDKDNQDGKRPETVTMILYANNEETGITVTLADNMADQDSTEATVDAYKGAEVDVKTSPFEAYVTNLPVYVNGVKQTYTWLEDTAALEGTGYTIKAIELTEDTYTEGEGEDAVTYKGLRTVITNTYTPDRFCLTVLKVWEDNNNEAGERKAVTVKLSGTITVDGETKDVDVSKLTKPDGTTFEDEYELSEDNNWAVIVTGLPIYHEGAEIEYLWTETTALENYEAAREYDDTGRITYLVNRYIEVPHKKETSPYEGTGELGGVKVGDEITYEISYKNYTFMDADVVITDTLDENVEFVEARDGGAEADGIVTWTIKDVPAGKSGKVTLTVRVLETAKKSKGGEGKVVNGGDSTTVIINETEYHVETVTNPVPEEPHKKETDPYEGTGTLGGVKVGDEITYEISYKNYKSEAADVTIKDKLDKNVEFVSASDDGVYDSTHKVTWTLKDVPANTEGTVTLKVKVLEGAKQSNGGEGKVVNGGPTATVQVREPRARRAAQEGDRSLRGHRRARPGQRGRRDHL